MRRLRTEGSDGSSGKGSQTKHLGGGGGGKKNRKTYPSALIEGCVLWTNGQRKARKRGGDVTENGRERGRRRDRDALEFLIFGGRIARTRAGPRGFSNCIALKLLGRFP